MKLFLLLILSQIPSAWAAPYGEIKLLKGKALIGVNPAKLGAKVELGDVITTGPQSFVRVKLTEAEAALQIGPNSTIQITKRDDATRVDLLKGFVLSAVKPKPAGGKPRFQVHTRNAALGVRGTVFFVKEEEDGRTFHCVCEGKVAVRWQSGSSEVSSKHHDAPEWISTDGKVSVAPMGPDHTDQEIDELKKLL